VSHRLYFRVEEALPLAEHAMSCPSHALTREQVAAAARLRPALILTATAGGIGLASNGVPSWYDEDGDSHTAPAWTWHHPGSGRRGTDTAATNLALTDTAPADTGPADTAPAGAALTGTAASSAPTAAAAAATAARFLPLSRRSRDRRDSLIRLLRTGARRGGHWLVIDTNPARHGSHDRWQVVDHRADLLPADTAWTATTVTAATVWHHRYPALVADGYTVRGDDVIARFDRDTVEQMATDLATVHAIGDSMPGEVASLHLDGDVAVVSFSHDDGQQESWAEVDRVQPDRQGFYMIGAYLWPWAH
jgi:hypothetical protein